MGSNPAGCLAATAVRWPASARNAAPPATASAARREGSPLLLSSLLAEHRQDGVRLGSGALLLVPQGEYPNEGGGVEGRVGGRTRSERSGRGASRRPSTSRCNTHWPAGTSHLSLVASGAM
jgi:hypothetical protein